MITRANKCIIFLSCLFFSLVYPLSFAFAVPHISGKIMGPKDYSRPIPKPIEVYENGVRKIISPVTGTHKIAIILADFPSAGSNTYDSSAITMSSDDITGFNTTFDYLKNFYDEASCGKLKLDITFIYQGSSTSVLTGSETPITMSKSMSDYGTGDETGSSTGLVSLIKEAISIAGTSVYISSAGYIRFL